MTAMRQAMNAYGQASETIPPAKQIVMLYDGIIRHLKIAKSAIDQGRINERYLATEKATTIIEALQGCLDHENGGEIAPQLDQLYTHFIFRLQAINIENDPKICDELLEAIGELRASWAGIAEAEAAPTTATSAADDAQPPSRPRVPAALTA